MAKATRTAAYFFINGIPYEISGEKAGWMLADFLRVELNLSGTKIVCAEGDCGACTVLRWHPLPSKKLSPSKFEAINSCIVTVAQMDGASLVTIEGLKPANCENLSSVQSAMLSCHGSQCGYCTPGFVMSLTSLAERRIATQNHEPISRKEAQNYLTGNLCRCTGYEPILKAAENIDILKMQSLEVKYLTSTIKKKLYEIVKTPLELNHPKFSFHAPIKGSLVSKVLSKNANCRILASATDLGVQLNKKKTTIPMAVNLKALPESYEILRVGKGRVKVGCSVSIAELRRFLEKSIPSFAQFLDLFASPQIKNVATLVGNIANASPIADTAPFLMVTNADLFLESSRGKRKIAISDFYLSYKKTSLRKNEWISAIEFDVPSNEEQLFLSKSSQRKDLDISCINFALRLRIKKNTHKILEAAFSIGGVGPIPMRLPKTEKLFVENDYNEALIAQVLDVFQTEISPLSDLRGSAAFRRVSLHHVLAKRLKELSLEMNTRVNS